MEVKEILIILVILYYQSLLMVLRSGVSDKTVKGQDRSQDCSKPSHVRDPIETYYLTLVKGKENKLNIYLKVESNVLLI